MGRRVRARLIPCLCVGWSRLAVSRPCAFWLLAHPEFDRVSRPQGPTGALTEASLEQAAGAVPELWGAFPRAMMELLSAPELSGATFHASAIEIYMEHAYDLLDGRKSVKVGSAKGAGRGTLVVADMGKDGREHIEIVLCGYSILQT